MADPNGDEGVSIRLDHVQVSTEAEVLRIYGRVEPPQNAPKTGANMLVLLDTSRTMSDPDEYLRNNFGITSKISATRKVLQSIISMLEDDDIFGLVTFNNTGKVIIASDVATDENKQIWTQILREDAHFQCRGRTNMEKGVKIGVSELSRVAEEHQRPSSCVVILSDGDVSSGAGFVNSFRHSRREAGVRDLVECINDTVKQAALNLTVTMNTCGVGEILSTELLRTIARKCGPCGRCETSTDLENQVQETFEYFKSLLDNARETIVVDERTTITIRAAQGVTLVPRSPLPEKGQDTSFQGNGMLSCTEVTEGKEYRIVVEHQQLKSFPSFTIAAMLEETQDPKESFQVAKIECNLWGRRRPQTLFVNRLPDSQPQPEPSIQARAEACEMTHSTARMLTELSDMSPDEQLKNSGATKASLQHESKITRRVMRHNEAFDPQAANEQRQVYMVLEKAIANIDGILKDMKDDEDPDRERYGQIMSNTLSSLASVLWAQMPSEKTFAFDPRIVGKLSEERLRRLRLELQSELDDIAGLERVNTFGGLEFGGTQVHFHEREDRLAELDRLFATARLPVDDDEDEDEDCGDDDDGEDGGADGSGENGSYPALATAPATGASRRRRSSARTSRSRRSVRPTREPGLLTAITEAGRAMSNGELSRTDAATQAVTAIVTGGYAALLSLGRLARGGPANEAEEDDEDDDDADSQR